MGDFGYSNLDWYYINEYLDSNLKLKRALDLIFNEYGKSDKFINAICIIFSSEPEKVVTLLHYYGLGNKIINNIACDFTDFITLCYPNIPFEEIPNGVKGLDLFQGKYNISEWDYSIDEIDHILDSENCHIKNVVLAELPNGSERLFEIPEDKVDLMKQFVMDYNFTDLKFDIKKEKSGKTR